MTELIAMSKREALKKRLLLLGELEQKIWKDFRKEREGIYARLGELDRQIQRHRRSNKEYYAHTSSNISVYEIKFHRF
ncbi:hypothetical protein DT075_22305 [Bacillus licheniformis]|nr:hypothetical protein DT075_22305 [Bacillus licheniformis]